MKRTFKIPVYLYQRRAKKMDKPAESYDNDDDEASPASERNDIQVIGELT